MNSWEFYSRIEMFKHTQKNDELAHYGITGQKWGQRRWQNPDGTFNPEGKERYFGSKSKKEKSSDTGVKDYIKYKNESSDQKQKFGSTYFWNDDTRRVHNDSYQNADGSLTKKGEKLLAKSQNGNEKAANKIKAKALIDMDMYNEYNKGQHLKLSEEDRQKKFNEMSNKMNLRKGDYSWEDDMKTILNSDKEYYDDKFKSIVAANADNIVKMVKALDNDDFDEYTRIRNENFVDDMEKDVSEKFVDDVRKLNNMYKEREQIVKDVDDAIGENTEKYLEGGNSLQYRGKSYKDGKADFISVNDFKNHGKGEQIKATESAKELEKNADQHFDNILDKLYSSLSSNGKLETWDDDHNDMSKSEFKKYMKDQKYKLVNSGRFEDDGSVMLYLNDADLYWGHVFNIDYNPLTGEFKYYGIEG